MRTNSWDTQPARPDESLITDVRTTIERLYRSDSDIQDGELVSEAAPLIRNVILKRIGECRDNLLSMHQHAYESTSEIVDLSDCVKVIIMISSLRSHSEIKNSIYINACDPTLGPIFTSFHDLRESVYKKWMNPSNQYGEDPRYFVSSYFQIVLNDTVTAKYMAAFLESNIGREILETIRLPLGDCPISYSQIGPSQEINTNLNTIFKGWELGQSELQKIPILRRDLNEQESYIALRTKVHTLRLQLGELEKLIDIGPLKMEHLRDQVGSLLSAIEPMTQEERIRKWCQQDESLTLEFKESYRVSSKDRSVDKQLQESALKEIVGMINSRGGTLLIGIHDKKKQPTELFEFEINRVSKNRDTFLNQLGSDIERRIGKAWVRFYNAQLVDYMHKPVLIVEVQRHPRGEFAYLDENPYVRQSEARTIKLDPKAWLDYTKMEESSTE